MTTMPAEITYGHVTGRFITAWTDGPDAGRLPDPRPLEGLTVKITPKVQARRLAGAAPVLVATMPVRCKVDADGRLIDEQGNPGVWLVTGVYTVTYAHPSVSIPAHDIEVSDTHTEDTPLDLVAAMPPGGPVLTVSQYTELRALIAALGDGGGGIPQTLSLSGSDLTLSDGGGTVTLPSGGGDVEQTGWVYLNDQIPNLQSGDFLRARRMGEWVRIDGYLTPRDWPSEFSISLPPEWAITETITAAGVDGGAPTGPIVSVGSSVTVWGARPGTRLRFGTANFRNV